jgi:Carbohydrate binding domain
MLLFVIFMACVGGYIIAVTRAYRAQKLADQSNQASLEQAVALDPYNADYHDLLCRIRISLFQNASMAIGECEEASELNAYSSTIWLDLAQAYYLTGNKDQVNAAVHKALAVDPTTPNTIWSAANFLLVHGDNTEALQHFSIVLQKEPSLAPATLNVCWRSLHDVNQITNILPPNPSVYLEFIRLLHSTNEFESADQVWSSLMQLRNNLDYRSSLFYVDDLLHAHRVAQATAAWKQLNKLSAPLQAYAQPGNIVTDGSFSQEILNSGFDWRYNPNSQVVVALDTSEFHSGGRSLRLAYSGAGGDAGIFQYIAVQPRSRYLLSAWVKSDDLTTANGPQLVLADAYNHDFLAGAQETVGTTSWHRVETEITTKSEASLLMLSILRRPAETGIRGTFWVDDIRLQQLPSTSKDNGHE